MLVVNGRDATTNAADRRRFLMMGLLRRFLGTTINAAPPAPEEPFVAPPPNIIDGNHLTVVQLVDSHPRLEREYLPEFVTECVLLQKSEMTMEDEFQQSIKKNLLGMLRLPQGRRRGLGIVEHHLDELDEVLLSDDDLDEHDPDLDPVAWLLDTDLDFNYDPKNEELATDYKYGGYHPVLRGEVYYSSHHDGRQYIILRKLGWGHFSTVWLAKCVGDDACDEYVALKFVKLNKNYMEAAEDEIRLLKCLQDPLQYATHLEPKHQQYFSEYLRDGVPLGHPGYHHVMKLVDDFRVTGPHGNHICMVFEILGENILHVIYKYKHMNHQWHQQQQAPQVEPCDLPTQFKFGKWGDLKKKSTKLMLLLGLRSPKKLAALLAALATLLMDLVVQLAPLTEMLLDNFTRTMGGLPLALVKQIVVQLLQSLDYMHHCGVIHTDLKPENILVEIKGVGDVIKELEEVKVQELQRRRLALQLLEVKAVRHSRRSILGRTRAELVGNYRLLKNLVLGTLCPVRTLKPLLRACLMLSLVHFKDFSFSGAHLEVLATLVSPQELVFALSGLESHLDDHISVKIADLGNGTFAHLHFTNQIQTRQYRAPEIILKYRTWGALTDLWLLGCIVFELLTGDYLFDPHEGKCYDKDEDHLAQIIELLGEMPLDQYLVDCKYTSKFFKIDDNHQTALRHIDNLKMWGLADVFVEKYKFDRGDVALMLDFILKCLQFELTERYDAALLLNHPWLTGTDSTCENKCHDVPGYFGTF